MSKNEKKRDFEILTLLIEFRLKLNYFIQNFFYFCGMNTDLSLSLSLWSASRFISSVTLA